MIQTLRHKKGQGTLEYAILIAVVIAAILSIQVYIKRGVQGRLRSATDDVGDQFAVGNGSNFVKTVNSFSHTIDTFKNGVSKQTLGAGGKYTNTVDTVRLNTTNNLAGDDTFTSY